MMTLPKTYLYFIILTVLLASCSTKAVINNNGQAVAKEKSKSIFTSEPSDYEMFEDALSCLKNNASETNDQEVKVKLENLLAKYPQSKWAESSQALIDTLERISRLKMQLRQEKQKSQSDQAKLTKEIEGLKENTEKFSSEINRLQQENEQLKNDIQQLKNLEIQLEKREKTLR